MPSPLAPGAIAGIVISVFAAIAVLLALLIIGILVVKNKSSERVAQNQPTSQAGGLKSEQKSSPDDSSSARRKAPVSDSHTKKPSQDPLAQVTGQHGLPQSSVHSPALSNKAQGSRSLDPIQSRVSIEELGEIVLYQVGVAIAENYMILLVHSIKVLDLCVKQANEQNFAANHADQLPEQVDPGLVSWYVNHSQELYDVQMNYHQDSTFVHSSDHLPGR